MLNVIWHYGNICNAACLYCMNKYAATITPYDIDYNQTVKAIEFLNSLHVDKVDLLGGEPTCFKYLPLIAQTLNTKNLEISTNGLLVNVIQHIAKIMKQNNKLLNICLSVHESIVNVDPKGTKERIKVYMDMAENNLIDMNIMTLIDGSKGHHIMPSQDFQDLILWMADEEQHRKGFDCELSFVRTSEHSNLIEFINAYSIAIRISPIAAKQLAKYRLDILRLNPWYKKPCTAFKHTFTLNMDGTLSFTICPTKPRTSKRSIYNDDFNIEDEYVTCTCDQKYLTCNGSCIRAQGYDKDHIPRDDNGNIIVINEPCSK